ncbi:MAG: DUF4287 domain-containing protein [Coprothermobacterota bacterium]|nr:DUF4287 domain-containing protein [Coprothermobacterota bacterium]
MADAANPSSNDGSHPHRHLPNKTGRSAEERAMIVRQQGSLTKKESIHWLQTVYGLGHGQAQRIVALARRTEVDSPSQIDLVAGQYAGTRQRLLPVHRRLVQKVQSLGDGANIDPRVTNVSLIRRRQFGIIQSKKEQVLLDLALPGQTFEGKWVDVRHLGSDRITHQIALASPEEVGEEISRWLFLASYRDHK